MPDWSKFQKSFDRAMLEVASPERMREYAQAASQIIRTRTRLGYGVPAMGKERQKLKALASSTKESRARLKDQGKLHAHTTPGKSNLTRSGQLLDSIQTTNTSQGIATIAPTGDRTEGQIGNREVAVYVAQAGRPFLALSEIEQRRIRDVIRKVLEQVIARYLT